MSKRIIELPDKVVQAIQNGEDYRYDIHTAIAQSTPYNPTGDLISRSALLNQIDTTDWSDVRLLVEDAPTVETFTLEDMQNNFDAGVDSIIGKYDKARGEWIFKNGKYRCTACGEKAIYCFNGSLAITQTELLTHFCPNCGADMRGGTV